MDTTFRSAPAAEAPADSQTSVTPKPEVAMTKETDIPYSLYQQQNKLPFTADYLDIKLTWDQASMVDDVGAVEEYIKDRISSGEVGDNVKQVREKLKSLEKLAGIDKIESQAQRIIKLSEFVKYLKSLEKRKNDIF